MSRLVFLLSLFLSGCMVYDPKFDAPIPDRYNQSDTDRGLYYFDIGARMSKRRDSLFVEMFGKDGNPTDSGMVRYYTLKINAEEFLNRSDYYIGQEIYRHFDAASPEEQDYFVSTIRDSVWRKRLEVRKKSNKKSL